MGWARVGMSHQQIDSVGHHPMGGGPIVRNIRQHCLGPLVVSTTL